jgi:RNA polymerase sigma factor for flagellar operon FliA
VEIDELISDGVIGLIGALQRYDPRRGVGFTTYAGHRIRGAMLDGLRARDAVPRGLRRAQKASPALAGMKIPVGATVVQFLELDEALTVPADEAAGPEEIALEADLLRQVRSGLNALPARDRKVLWLRTMRGLPLRAVAEQLSISITRTAEIQARGVTRLRRFLAGEPMIRARGRA